jgi:hypothetical protein
MAFINAGIIIAFINLIFFFLLKSPTAKVEKFLTTEGFKWFQTVTEKTE